MMDYNVPLGKLNRGMAVLDVVASLAEARGQALSKEEVFRASALGWCIEFLQVGRAAAAG
jgi:farnesyl diphosphate synthase